MKKSKISIVLMSVLFIPTLVLGNVSKVHACSKWNPFCKNKDILIIPSPPFPTSQPSVQAYPKLLSDYYVSDTVWDQLPTPHISKKFTSDERYLIWSSLDKIQEIFRKPAFYECVESYTTKKNGDGNDPTIYNGSKPGFAVAAFISNFPRNDKSGGRPHLLFIDKVQLEGSRLGQANRPRRKGDMYDFIIELNTNKFSKFTSQNLWAGVIVHEMLHNVGYDHPDIVNGNFDPIIGNFVYETGYCANGEGNRTTFLTEDSKLFVD
jgi:hypothetical protein